MKAHSKPTEKRERSVFSTIFISVLVILAVEVTLLIGSIAVSRVPQQLDRNAEDILAKQVENRSRYLEDFLVQAQNLGDMPNRINEKTEALLTSGQISKDTLGQSSASSEPLLEAIADDMHYSISYIKKLYKQGIETITIKEFGGGANAKTIDRKES